MPSISLIKLAEYLSGGLEGDDCLITGINALGEAGGEEVSFLSNPRYAKMVDTTKAAAIIMGDKSDSCGKRVIRVKDAYYAALMTVKYFHPEEEKYYPGIHPSAVIAEGAIIGKDPCIEACAVIGDKSVIGDRVRIGANSVIEKNCRIGDDVIIHSGAVVRHNVIIGNRVIIHPGAVIGSEGFGFAPVEGKFVKIPQVGTVIIEDDADIGSNTCIDRAFLGATRIGKGVKLDNLIQVAHNVEIGAHTVIAAQTGISGSTTIGQGVMMGGQVGIVGHIHIGDGVRVGAQSGISKDVPPGVTMFGYPAKPIMETKRIEAVLRRLPELAKKVKKLEDSLKKEKE